MKPRVLIALSTFAEHDDAPLRALADHAELVINRTGRRLTADEIIEMGRDCVGVVAGVEPYDARVLGALPGMKCISRCGVGIDNIALPEARRLGVDVRNTPDIVTAPVAEFTIALIFDLLKNLTWHTQVLRARDWKKRTGEMLAGRTVGVIGLGRIGKRVAEMLHRLDAVVIGADVAPDQSWAQAHGVRLAPIDALLAASDVVTLHVSKAAGVPFRLGDAELAQMKEGAVLVNVARGDCVDESALERALRSGRLAGAGLDVFSAEPYAGPLSDLDTVVLTPHIATLTRQSRAAMELEAAANLADWLKTRSARE